MQVKKFEARNMKEALQLVKNSMGPEAIILSAKDINAGFGIAGGAGVEVTAAASEQTMRKKRFAESRMNERDLARFTSSSAADQKRYIEQAVERQVQRSAPKPQITRRSYIDIHDEEAVEATQRIQPTIYQEEVNFQNSSRVKSAAQAAKLAAFDIEEDARQKELRRRRAQQRRAQQLRDDSAKTKGNSRAE